jgi:excisionase family DNA binding protein
MNVDKILVNRKEAARLLSVSLRSLDYLIMRRELLARRVGRRVLIPRRALEQFALRDHPALSPVPRAEVEPIIKDGTVPSGKERP